MENVTTFKDLIRTIEDDEEVEDLSESSDVEVEFQPSKQIGKKNETFAEDFTFVSTEEEYNKDSWNDIKKYIKRKAKSKTDDKINKHRPKQNDEENNSDAEEKQDSGAELDLSDDELAHDRITAKKKKILGKNNKEEEEPGNEQHFDGNNDIMNFQQMNLSRPLLKSISDMKFVHPTPIQCATIPVALLGRDICGCAATGTGKTAAYMLPTLERLLYRPTEATSLTRVLVLVPTRELGVQVYQVSKQLCQYTDIQLGLAVGGLDLKTQENILRKNPDIVIATPGRLIDHLKSTPTFGLDSIEVLILDEADRMLDEYFAEQMKEIIKQCSRTRQTMLFSATMTEEVENLAAVSLVDPVRLFVDSNKDVAFNLRQEFVRIRSGKEADREAILGALVCRTFRESCIIFVQTKKQAHRLHILLGLLGLKVAELHGNLTQPQRLEALEKFKNKSVDVLVATDVAARGLDIPGVKTVVNFVMPFLLEHYIHRVGRTARAGRAGVSVSLAGEQERKMVKDIIKRAKYPVKNRVIPPDIIEKYRQKITKLEPKITQILLEEEEERLLSKAENQANKMEKMLAGSKDPVRPWFQTKKERKSEKDNLKLKVNAGGKKVLKGKDKKDKGGQNPDPESEEIAKIAAVQARMVKKKIKQKKINAVRNEVGGGGGQAGGKKRKSHFEDLVNTKNAKKLRYQSKFQQNKRGNKKGKR
ncbi:probable ATP-dependent RNA helicase DDX27 [Anthonomus grandis grandis]|uniref:probable ATP-dependent RNA helicase DDX27 n=1 Tax=Anthonomus grandis grandis TaxID=2921223 RepID=UPI002166401C|nr:probable ATP-dependent RNA helicase DDX27 [Anthonomus grandis grandis]